MADGWSVLDAVVRQGEVVEEGSHKELVAIPNGSYATLVHLQQQRATVGDEDADDLVRCPAYTAQGACVKHALTHRRCFLNARSVGFSRGEELPLLFSAYTNRS